MANHAYDDEVWEAFCEAIPEKYREDILTNMSEAAHSDRYQTDQVRILNRTRHDMINVTVEGIVSYNDREYSFHLEDGNWNGTQLRGWNGLGSEWEEYVPTPLALAPRGNLISAALAPGGNPAFLLKKWDLFLTREDVNKILRDYAYDRFFQPGGVVENHYRDKVESLGLVITTKEDADQIRKRLELASQNGDKPKT